MLKKLLPMIVLTFVNTIGFSLLIPTLPFIVKDFGYGSATYGLILSIYSLCQFLAAPLLGSLSDIYGRKKILIVSHTGTLLSWFVFALSYFINHEVSILGFSLSLIIIIFSRITDGLTGGNISVASAYVSDITKPEERAKAFGIIGATFGIGFLVGPVLGAFSSSTQYGYLGMCVVAAFISLIALFLLLNIKESLTERRASKKLHLEFIENISFIKKFLKHKNNPKIVDSLKFRFLTSVVFTAYNSIFILMLADVFNFEEKGSGIVFAFIGIYLIINQGYLVPKIISKIGVSKTLLLSIVLGSVGLFTLPFVTDIYVFLINAYLISLAIAIWFLTIKTVITKNTDKNNQGEVIGLDDSLISLNSAYVPFLSGYLYTVLGVNLFFILGIILIPGIWILNKIKNE